MEAKELRIGNYVYCGLASSVDGIIKIENFSEIINYAEAYEPIKLTEEWLLKFCFSLFGENATDSKSPDDWYWVSKKGNFPSIGNINWNIYNANSNIKCKYVHQLQNLYFALTGEELLTNNKEEKK